MLLFVSLSIQTQNKQVLYGFAENPQTLLLNPGAETNYKFHIGIPFLSGMSGDVALKNFKLNDLFSEDGIDFNTKILIKPILVSAFTKNWMPLLTGPKM